MLTFNLLALEIMVAELLFLYFFFNNFKQIIVFIIYLKIKIILGWNACSKRKSLHCTTQRF